MGPQGPIQTGSPEFRTRRSIWVMRINSKLHTHTQNMGLPLPEKYRSENATLTLVQGTRGELGRSWWLEGGFNIINIAFFPGHSS